MVFAIHWHESAMDLHVFPIPSLWVFPVHQPWALVSCIQPGLVICFTLEASHCFLFTQRARYLQGHEHRWLVSLGASLKLPTTQNLPSIRTADLEKGKTVEIFLFFYQHHLQSIKTSSFLENFPVEELEHGRICTVWGIFADATILLLAM